MVTQRMCLVGSLLLFALLPPADAQVEPSVEASGPMELLPLEVGNQWTYVHYYSNDLFEYRDNYYGGDFWAEPSSPVRAIVRALFEIPGFPYYPDDRDKPYGPDDYDEIERYARPPFRDLTIEITHIEIIEGQEYFVFSDVDYDWPPVPNLFLAGQKVRFSDEGALLFRWNGQDIPLYVFREDAYYITPAYPVLHNENLPVEHTFWADFLPASKLGDSWDLSHEGLSHIGMTPPPLLGLATAVVFSVTLDHSFSLGFIRFVADYGIVTYNRYLPGTGDLGVIFKDFENSILPISAVIGGKKLEFSYHPINRTNVQSTTWGQLKARHGQRP